ncbi:MAG: transposase [Helicobacteraceae bacterium]|nr:transposase [Helicobacteraceae bacterium]
MGCPLRVRPENLHKVIFRKYIYRRQILKDLAADYKRSIPWVRKQILEYEPEEKIHNPREVVLVCDTTFYGKKSAKLGTMVFKDTLTGEVLIWKHVESELVKDYKQLIQRLLDYGYIIKAVTIDGKRGLFKALNDYPIQMCHFHQKKVIQRYITMHPRLEAGKELQKIMRTLTTTTETRFTNKLNIWYEIYKDFLAEKTLNIETNKESYKHQKLVSAYRSLRRNSPYLFTYKKYPKLKINNTTNALDGGVFSPMKKLMKVHAGFNKSLKLKIADEYLVNYKKK